MTIELHSGVLVTTSSRVVTGDTCVSLTASAERFALYVALDMTAGEARKLAAELIESAESAEKQAREADYMAKYEAKNGVQQ